MIPFKYTWRSLQARWVASLMTIAGSALAVAASVVAFGLADGLDRTLQVSGDPLDVIVMRKGADAETNSVMTEELVRQLKALSGIATDAEGEKIFAGELVYIENAPRRGEMGKGNLIIRGVTPMSRVLRADFKITKGEDVQPGLREALVSPGVADRFDNAGLGEELLIANNKFKIVGLFTAGGGAAESEVWVDLKVLQQTTKREGYVNAVQFRVVSDEQAVNLTHKIQNDEQFNQKALTERKYFAEQANSGNILRVVGSIIAFFLILGSTFAVANTMYGVIASRAREIGTLRSLGFPRRDILASFLLESVLLSLAGGLLGCLLSLPFNGWKTGTANWLTFSEVSFAFEFGWATLLQALTLALAMGIVGGLLPAIRAVRMKVVDALREI